MLEKRVSGTRAGDLTPDSRPVGLTPTNHIDRDVCGGVVDPEDPHQAATLPRFKPDDPRVAMVRAIWSGVMIFPPTSAAALGMP
jgi:hypothetical protein